jgi:hypothetical protein
MSDEIATQSAEPVEGSPTSDSVITETPDTPTLNVQEYSNHRVPVKLDGEELQVPLSEAIAGYQRQADYTRKTQELSQQREKIEFASTLQAALENNPAATLSLLSQHYSVQNTPQVDPIEEESLTQEERKIRELDKRVASFEEFQNQQQIEKEIANLQTKYSDFDVKEVVSNALRMNTTDLEGTYKQLAFDKIVAQSKIETAAKERLKQADDGVLEAKRAASVVSGGSSATSSTTTEKAAPIKSVSEAWAAAKRQMGAN